MMEAMEVIYLDELFAVNALIDGLLLLLAAEAAGLSPRRGRVLLSALLGGGYAVLSALMPGSILPSPPGKLGAAVLLSAAAFGWGKELRKGCAAFLGVSALFAGAVFAAALLSGRRVGPESVAAGISLRLLGVCLGLCWAGLRFIRSRKPPDGKIFPVELRLGQRRADLSVLRDTGNSLSDPLSGWPILVADAHAVSPLLGMTLPEPVPRDAAALFSLLSRDEALRPRLGLAPYRAVGAEGLLLTLRPDSVLWAGETVRALVGVSPTPLGNGEYNAVF